MGLKIWVQEWQKCISEGYKGQYKIKTFATSSLKLKKRENALPCIDYNFPVARILLLDSPLFYMIGKLKLPPNFCMTIVFHWEQDNIYFMFLSPLWPYFFLIKGHKDHCLSSAPVPWCPTFSDKLHLQGEEVDVKARPTQHLWPSLWILMEASQEILLFHEVDSKCHWWHFPLPTSNTHSVSWWSANQRCLQDQKL